MRSIARCGVFLCGALLLGYLMPAGRAAELKTPRELMQYIEEAKKLGLRDEVIRQNALRAGWDTTMIEQAFSIMLQPRDAAGNPKVPFGYKIGSGDILQIVVWKEPEASVPAVVVRSDGKISIPLLKEIEVIGFAPAELETLLTAQLSKFIRGADVTVIPTQIHSQKVYMIGGVKKEGTLSLQSSMTVLQAITECGGLTEYAKPRKIYVLRNQGGKPARLPFDYEAVIEGLRPEQNIQLLPNDTVVVPR
jgi:polysaccharide export outer membrane protein